MFKTWLTSRFTPSFSCTLQELRLTNINEIFAQATFDHQQKLMMMQESLQEMINCETFINDSTTQTLILAEQKADNYARKANDENNKLYRRRASSKNVQHLNHTIDAIENRSKQLMQRIQYDTKQKQRMISEQG